MDRLTLRTGTQVSYIGKHTRVPGLDSAGSMRVAGVRDVMDRLADYEDTGVSPEEINALKQAVGEALAPVTQTLVEVVPQIVQTVVELAPQIAQCASAALRRITPEMTPEQIMELLRENPQKN